MNELKQEQLMKRTYAKVQWAVKAYQEWRSNRMSHLQLFDVCIYETDLENVYCLERDSFEFAICQFLAEVRKIDGSEYPGKTLYQLVVSIQTHINTKGKKWKLIDNVMLGKLRTVLDNLMKERAKANIGTVKRQASMITYDVEEKLWGSG